MAQNLLKKIFPGWAMKREMSLFKLQQLQKAKEVMESLPAWAQDTDEKSWKNLGEGREHYTEAEHTTMQSNFRHMYLVNPGARGLIDSLVRFIVGKECKTVPLDLKLKAYWDEFCKVNKFDDRKKEEIRRTAREGEIFIRFFSPKIKVNSVNAPAVNVPLMRFIDPEEITDHNNKHSFGIETDPDDIETPVNYFRTFKKADGTIAHEVIPAEEIIHLKIMCDSNEKRGKSWLIGIATYLQHFDNWLLDRITLNHLRNLFNLIVTPDGVSPAGFASTMPSSTTQGTGGDTINKKLPKSGSMIISRGLTYEFKNLNLDASDTATDGRQIERMICKGTGFVEGVVTGDYSNSNLASSLVAESPMVKAIDEWQDMFGNHWKEIVMFVMRYGQKHGLVPKNIDETVTTSFSSLVHRDLMADTTAYQMHKMNRWGSDRTISGQLGYDYDKEQKEIEQEEGVERKRAEKNEQPPPGQERQAGEQGQQGQQQELNQP